MLLALDAQIQNTAFLLKYTPSSTSADCSKGQKNNKLSWLAVMQKSNVSAKG
jgi:hypothetical protein